MAIPKFGSPAASSRNIAVCRTNSLATTFTIRGILRKGLGLMTLDLSALVERLFGAPPWATCPAESFEERFAELEQRLRAAYPEEKGFHTRVTRKKGSWVAYVRNGLWSGFAVHCEPVYGAESFAPTGVSVWVGAYSRGLHLALYLLVALTSAPLIALAKFLVPRLVTNPVVLLAFWPLFLLALLALFPLLATLLAATERSLRGKVQLEDVRALVRSVLTADDRVLLPETAWARRLQGVLPGVIVVMGLTALAFGGGALWEWWSFWDDPVNSEMAQSGYLETMQNARAVYLVFGTVLSLLGVLIFWGYALMRHVAAQQPPSQPLQLTGPASRQSEAGSSSGPVAGLDVN
jgi:hypothetical protein